MVKVAVVILNYNGESFLKKFLQKVVNYSTEAEVIVVDNNSNDNSVEYLKTNHPEVRIIEIEENRGFCGGYNTSLKQIEAEYYVILNSDVEVTENWIAPIISFMDKYPNTAACQPKILSYHQKSHFEYAGAAGGYIDFLGYPFCRGRIFLSLEEDKGQYNDIKRIFWATGACLFIRSKVFHQLGGFDEEYFAHMEEIDLCWRINRAGMEVHYVGSSSVYHVGGGTLSKENPKKTYLNFRNSLITVFKNSTKTSLAYKLPARMLLDLIAAIKFLLTDGKDSFNAVLRANLDFYLHLWKYIKRRKGSQKFSIVRTPLQYKNSIVLDYYVYGKQNFNDLKISK